MFLDLTESQKQLRDEVRAYFARLGDEGLAGHLRGEAHGDTYRRLIRRLGQDGWLGVGWPTEYGGQGRTAIEQLIFFDEAERARVPVPLVTLNTVGPTLMSHGSQEQRDAFLPKILSGEIHFAIGYTEPEAGTDLASLRTRAVRDGDEYVVNGSKVFTSNAEDADYIWLAVRTDPDAPKHKGISILIVDTSTPGFKVTPIATMSGIMTTATYYEDVRVPVEMRVGEENEGWRLITTQLNHERVALAASGWATTLVDEVFEWARDSGAIEMPWVQLDLARVHAKFAALQLLNYRMAWAIEAGELSPADAAAVKVYSSELYVEAFKLLMEVVGESGYLREGSPGAALRGKLDWGYQSAFINTFGGGVNEVQRAIIATVGLGMPRSR
jgi:hypothetical protein